MKAQSIPVSAGLTNHLKMKIIETEHGPKVRAFMLASLIELWTQCHFDYQDGIIKKSALDIEIMVRWQGEKGKFIEITTDERTCFINKIDDNEYQVHNYNKRNSYYRPEVRKEVSMQKSKAAHTSWAKRTVKMMETKGIKIKDCPWLHYVEDGQFHYIRVEYNNLPDYIELENETFHKRSHFEETNKNSDPKVQADRRRLIRRHTKKCNKCGILFISSLSNKCIGCR